MAGKEKPRGKMSRREALFLGALTLGAGAIAIEGKSLEDKLYPFWGLLSQEKPGSVKPEDLKELIFIQDGIEVPVGLDQKRKAFVDKDAFCYLLFNISKYILPYDGPEKLQAILKKKPLKIVLSLDKLEQFKIKETSYDSVATYTPYYYGGPRIDFAVEYLRSYRRNQVDTDLAKQLNSDGTIVHEMVHLWQDICYPFYIPFGSAYYDFRHTSYDEKSYEIEAEKVSMAFIEKQYKDFLTMPEPRYWNFARAFNFV
jgi:hypothetical protein